MNRPYIEKVVDENIVIRMFENTVPDEELQWHWDEKDRIVEPLNENDWQFQFDNELPFTINRMINIPAGVIHRVIKGNGPLIIKITEHEAH